MPNDIRVNKTEINRLTKAIAAEEQNINLAFQRMGQTYFAAHRNDPEESQRGDIQAVLDAIQRASAYKDQINVLRGIAICPNCKAEVDSSAAFCSHCGARMPVQAPPPQPAAPNALTCPNCGNVCAPGTRFCNLCGTRIPEAPPAGQAPVYAPNPSQAPVYAPNPQQAPVYAPIPPQAPVFAPNPAPTPAYTPNPAPAPTYSPVPESAPVSAPVPEPAQEPSPAADRS
ncbi:MAG: zinc ribbon domain-containing protein, partial [Oscillospiraceae bacterium]|nr:zinc ribbon domain-containing protein [Oscillospiraceae bacterium]